MPTDAREQLDDSVTDRPSTPARRDDRGRGAVHVSARLRVSDADEGFVVPVRNLSAGGMMAELPHPLPPDCVVQVQLDGVGWITGRIVWQTEGRTGVAFDEVIDLALVRDASASSRH